MIDQVRSRRELISHSKSPKIHALFAQQTGQAMDYTAIQAPLDGFSDVVESFFDGGGKD